MSEQKEKRDDSEKDVGARQSFRWKGRFTSARVYNQRTKLTEAGKKRKLICDENVDAASEPIGTNIEGRRIINLAVLSEKLICTFCKEVLSLKYIVKETHKGLASIFDIRCHHCLFVNEVPTDSPKQMETGQIHYSVNLRAVLGTLHKGMGYTHLNSVLASLNIPCLSSYQFKQYEREIGRVSESVAKRSCEDAVRLERRLTIENLDALQKMLPNDLPVNFLVPSCTPISNSWNDVDINDEDVVRLMVSYDMGWSKRGTGRNYDSLNGYGALNGSQSAKILDFGTRNRKCRKCDSGVAKDEHDCRLNFEGSAKAMEPNLAIQLCTKSSILKDANTEVGILIGDDDSSTIAGVRMASDHPVVKFSDQNHTAKGVTKELYNVQKQHKELTKDAINYLHRCFTYAVSQNKGDSAAIADILRQIPDHAFNHHEKCGKWCGYQTDNNNYKHRTVLGGFHSRSLHLTLRNKFDQLAKNVEKFAHGMSSQANENLNAIMASKNPKSRCYSLGPSSDYRFALTVANKNIGPDYLLKIMSDLKLSPGKHTSKYTTMMVVTANQRKKKIVTAEFKARRNILKKYRAALRHKKEIKEGTTYQSNMGLLQHSALAAPADTHSGDGAIVFFDLETSGFMKTAEVLQIGARYEGQSFGVYINPTRPIASSASLVNGLRNISGELFLHDVRVDARPLRVALEKFNDFLLAIGRPSVLVAHNCKFDSVHLLNAIETVGMSAQFDGVISGFVDTLPIFRQVLQRSKDCSQTHLAAEFLKISDDCAHDAVHDVAVLQQLVAKLNIPQNVLIEQRKSIKEIVAQESRAKLTNETAKTLTPLEGVVSTQMRVKLASAGIDFNKLVDTFLSGGENATEMLMAEEIDGKPRVTKNSKVINSVTDFLIDII